MFWFYVSRRKIEVKRPDILVSDSVNVYPCVFQFSDDWKGLNKHVVFKAGQTSIEILLGADNTCNIPWEVLIKPKLDVYVGVYGTQGEAVILNTIWRSLGKVEEGPKTSNQSGDEPTPDQYMQLLAIIGSMDELETEQKDNLVSAINNVYESTLKNQEEKVDKTGDVVTGPLLFAENSAIMSYTFEDEPVEPDQEEDQKGVWVSSEGLLKDSAGPLYIGTESKEVSFGEETKLTGVVGDLQDETSVPNMAQLKDVIDQIPRIMTAEELREILTKV